MIKRIASFAGILTLALSVGCGKGNFSKLDSGSKANTFRYPIYQNPTTLDPGMVQDGDTIDLLQQVYEGLVGWGPDSQVHPMMAESWEVKNGGTAYIFHLRKGVKFTNGREVHADDFKWTFERNCAHSFPSPVVSDYLDDIVGFDDYHAGKSNDLPGVRVIDPYTLEIDIKAARAYFLAKLTYLDSAVLCKEAIKPGEQIKSPDEMVGTGPFKCLNYVPQQITVLEANKDYHGGAPLVDKIERPVVMDAATRLNLYKQGDIDLVFLEREDVAGIQADPSLSKEIHFYDRPSIFYVGMNPKGSPALGNVHLRRAIAMAIDRDSIVRNQLGGLVPVATGIIPPKVLGHRDKTAILPFDPAAAKKELALAGYTDPTKVPEFTLMYRSDRPDYQIVSEAVQAQLKQNLGINVLTTKLDTATYLSTWDEGKIGFFHMRWAADYLDPQDFLSMMLATYGNEDRGVNYNNPKFDALCRQADAEQDPQKRINLYAQAEDLALQEAPWVPIYFQRDAELVKPRVQGIRDSLFGHLPHTTVRLTQ